MHIDVSTVESSTWRCRPTSDVVLGEGLHPRVPLVNFAFSPSFAGAIEAKVRAQQEKLRAKRDLQRIEVEAQQRIASARDEAESLRLQRGEIIQRQLELRRVETERLTIAKWNGVLPPTAPGPGVQPFLNLSSR